MCQGDVDCPGVLVCTQSANFSCQCASSFQFQGPDCLDAGVATMFHRVVFGLFLVWSLLVLSAIMVGLSRVKREKRRAPTSVLMVVLVLNLACQITELAFYAYQSSSAWAIQLTSTTYGASKLPSYYYVSTLFSALVVFFVLLGVSTLGYAALDILSHTQNKTFFKQEGLQAIPGASRILSLQLLYCPVALVLIFVYADAFYLVIAITSAFLLGLFLFGMRRINRTYQTLKASKVIVNSKARKLERAVEDLRRVVIQVVVLLATLMALCIALVDLVFQTEAVYRFEAEGSPATATWMLTGFNLICLSMQTSLAAYCTDIRGNVLICFKPRSGRKAIHRNMYSSNPGGSLVMSQQIGSKVAKFKPRLKVDAVRDDISSFADDGVVFNQKDTGSQVSPSKQIDFDDEGVDRVG